MVSIASNLLILKVYSDGPSKGEVHGLLFLDFMSGGSYISELRDSFSTACGLAPMQPLLGFALGKNLRGGDLSTGYRSGTKCCCLSMKCPL